MDLVRSYSQLSRENTSYRYQLTEGTPPMVKIQMTELQLEILRSALRYIFDEIEDDEVFEELIGSTRWEAEELMDSLPAKGNRA